MGKKIIIPGLNNNEFSIFVKEADMITFILKDLDNGVLIEERILLAIDLFRLFASDTGKIILKNKSKLRKIMRRKIEEFSLDEHGKENDTLMDLMDDMLTYLNNVDNNEQVENNMQE